MYWGSPLLAKAVSLGLVEPRRLARLDRRVRRRARDLPSCDLIWTEELVHARCITRYQAQALLRSTAFAPHPASPTMPAIDPETEQKPTVAGVHSAAQETVDGPAASAHAPGPEHRSDPLQIGPFLVFDRAGRSDLGATYR